MLRITVSHRDGQTILKLEGKLAGPWVEELERCWLSLSSARSSSRVVDFSEVSFVSPSGKQLLDQLHREGAVLVGDGPLTTAIVDEITHD